MVTVAEIRKIRQQLLNQAEKTAELLASRASGAASKNISLVLSIGQLRAQARALDWVLGEGEL